MASLIDKPFKDLQVIELASILAGPAVGMFFAELGANVIKIENPKTDGDATRKWKSPEENDTNELSAYYQSVNWGKRVLFIDISSESGYEEIQNLLYTADILLVNFNSRDIEKFKLDFDSLKKKFPRLICWYISGYGEKDNRPAFDLVMQAETGFMSMNGTLESGPLKMPVALIDLMAAHQLKEGILTSLFLREKSGLGNSVSVSLFDSAIASLANQASNFLITGNSPQRMGSLHPNSAPYGETFLCADGRYIILAIGTQKQFSQFCNVIGQPELITKPKFSTNQLRVLNRATLKESIDPFFLKRISTQIQNILEQGEVPFSIIKSVGEILESKEVSGLLIDKKLVKTAVFKIH